MPMIVPIVQVEDNLVRCNLHGPAIHWNRHRKTCAGGIGCATIESDSKWYNQGRKTLRTCFLMILGKMKFLIFSKIFIFFWKFWQIGSIFRNFRNFEKFLCWKNIFRYKNKKTKCFFKSRETELFRTKKLSWIDHGSSENGLSTFCQKNSTFRYDPGSIKKNNCYMNVVYERVRWGEAFGFWHW